jgi:Cro/C1-type HTH DNA-binding domain
MIRPWFRQAAVPWKTTATQTRASGENRVSTKPGVIQVYRLVTRTPERLSLTTLVALCDILGCEPGDLVEPVASGGRGGLPGPGPDPGARPAGPVRPRRARILPGPGKDA